MMTAASFAVAAAAAAAIAAAYGFASFGRAWANLHPGWIAAAIFAQLLAIPAYALSYRTLAQTRGGPALPIPLVLRVVIAGFGPFASGGGFALDQNALQAIEGDRQKAVERVLGLGALEWTLLAPAACLTAIGLLAVGDPRPMPSLLWPWALAVPIGFIVGFGLATPERARRISAGRGRWRGSVGRALRGVGIVRTLASSFTKYWAAWVGTALYWGFDISAFYAAVRFVGLRADVGETILGYATGYALTRRSMSLGGAGITEALMTFALHWVGQPVAPALAAVLVYRAFNFALPAVPALLIQPRIQPLLIAAEEGRAPTREERRDAAAPFLPARQ